MKKLKRQNIPKTWPINRKGSTFVVKPLSNLNKGIPILIALRDILKIVQNRKEAKKIIKAKKILLNKKQIKDEKKPLLLFDVIELIPLKKYYRIDLSENGKFDVKEIPEKESYYKISKIIGKKTIKGKKTQINLIDNYNFISDIKCNIGDSVLIDFNKKAIQECIELKKNSNALIFAGKHSGKKGTIKEIKEKMAIIKTNKEEINVLIKQLMVIK